MKIISIFPADLLQQVIAQRKGNPIVLYDSITDSTVMVSEVHIDGKCALLYNPLKMFDHTKGAHLILSVEDDAKVEWSCSDSRPPATGPPPGMR